jgi:hypothetical protein
MRGMQSPHQVTSLRQAALPDDPELLELKGDIDPAQCAEKFLTQFIEVELGGKFLGFRYPYSRKLVINDAVDLQFKDSSDPRIPILHLAHDWCDLIEDIEKPPLMYDPMPYDVEIKKRRSLAKEFFRVVSRWADQTGKPRLSLKAKQLSETM